MPIQRCKNCANEFKWKTIMRSISEGYGTIECNSCRTKHHLYFIYRLINSALIILPLLLKKTLFDLFDIFSIIAYFVWFFIVLCISPFYVRYYIKNR